MGSSSSQPLPPEVLGVNRQNHNRNYPGHTVSSRNGGENGGESMQNSTIFFNHLFSFPIIPKVYLEEAHFTCLIMANIHNLKCNQSMTFNKIEFRGVYFLLLRCVRFDGFEIEISFSMPGYFSTRNSTNSLDKK